ncbi:MAG: hypothetical protein KGI58_02135 [Patescibacteria group bacterium]|nr:hypothetical protein [Patescibacteria group bacterium]
MEKTSSLSKGFDLLEFCKKYDLDLQRTANQLGVKIPKAKFKKVRQLSEAKNGLMRASGDNSDEVKFYAEKWIELATCPEELSDIFDELSADKAQGNDNRGELYTKANNKFKKLCFAKIKTSNLQELKDLHLLIKDRAYEKVDIELFKKWGDKAHNLKELAELHEALDDYLGLEPFDKLSKDVLVRLASFHGFEPK